jgi:hypothetical protein
MGHSFPQFLRASGICRWGRHPPAGQPTLGRSHPQNRQRFRETFQDCTNTVRCRFAPSARRLRFRHLCPQAGRIGPGAQDRPLAERSAILPSRTPPQSHQEGRQGRSSPLPDDLTPDDRAPAHGPPASRWTGVAPNPQDALQRAARRPPEPALPDDQPPAQAAILVAPRPMPAARHWYDKLRIGGARLIPKHPDLRPGCPATPHADRNAEARAMDPKDLPLWLTAMQAVTWLVTGDAALVMQAKPDQPQGSVIPRTRGKTPGGSPKSCSVCCGLWWENGG